MFKLIWSMGQIQPSGKSLGTTVYLVQQETDTTGHRKRNNVCILLCSCQVYSFDLLTEIAGSSGQSPFFGSSVQWKIFHNLNFAKGLETVSTIQRMGKDISGVQEDQPGQILLSCFLICIAGAWTKIMSSLCKEVYMQIKIFPSLNSSQSEFMKGIDKVKQQISCTAKNRIHVSWVHSTGNSVYVLGASTGSVGSLPVVHPTRISRLMDSNTTAYCVPEINVFSISATHRGARGEICTPFIGKSVSVTLNHDFSPNKILVMYLPEVFYLLLHFYLITTFS